MSADEKDDLDDILDAYEQRKAQEREDRSKQQEKEKALQEKSTLIKTILPVLEEFKERLITKDHDATVHRMSAGTTNLFVSLDFWIGERAKKKATGQPIDPSSTISFADDRPGSIVVSWTVKTETGDIEGAGKDSVPSENVDRAWVEKQVLTLVKAVLEAN